MCEVPGSGALTHTKSGSGCLAMPKEYLDHQDCGTHLGNISKDELVKVASVICVLLEGFM
ncbi:hypothetical protein CUMW_037760 [Citrus unshiu]|nr:hypothetical protein CUMW_037760 [Citrus unshiu]